MSPTSDSCAMATACRSRRRHSQFSMAAHGPCSARHEEEDCPPLPALASASPPCAPPGGMRRPAPHRAELIRAMDGAGHRAERAGVRAREGPDEACSALGVKTLGLHTTLCATVSEMRPRELHQHGVLFTNLRSEPIRPGAFSELW